MGDQAKESENAKPPWVVQSGLWELPRGRQGDCFQLVQLAPLWLSWAALSRPLAQEECRSRASCLSDP